MESNLQSPPDDSSDARSKFHKPTNDAANRNFRRRSPAKPSSSSEDEEKGKSVEAVRMREGVASIALLPCGSLSGHFVQLPHSICYGLHGTELACERECSRGEDYRLIRLTIIDYNSKREQSVVVECKGHDAASFHNIHHAHGWEKDVMGMVEERKEKGKISISFECDTLKSDKAAEEHINRFMPKLSGLDAIVNVGRMSIVGLDFQAETGESVQDM